MGADWRGQIAIYGVGARTHSGLDALSAAMTNRAGKLRVLVSHMLDRAGDPVGTCRAGWVADNLFGVARFVPLAAPALHEAYSSASDLPGAIPVYLAIGESLACTALAADGAAKLLARLGDEGGVPVDTQRSLVVAEGRAGGAHVLAEACAALMQPGAPRAVLVGGVDSYFCPDIVDRLDAEFRLHSASNENGFIPGEGSAFVLLAKRGALQERPYAVVLGASTALEPHPFGSEQPCHARGVVEAVSGALSAVGATRRVVDVVLTDVVNERHRVDEWQLASARLSRAFSQHGEAERPLVQTGDLGGATLPFFLAYASVSYRVAHALGPLTLCVGHSDGPHRGAVLLRDGDVE